MLMEQHHDHQRVENDKERRQPRRATAQHGKREGQERSGAVSDYNIHMEEDVIMPAGKAEIDDEDHRHDEPQPG